MPKPVFQFLVIIFLSFFTNDFAKSDEADEVFKPRFKGWEGVIFNCFESENIKNSICETIKTDAKNLATAYSINLQTVDNFPEMMHFHYKRNLLILEASVQLHETSSTNTRCETCSIDVVLTAYAFYIAGINVDPSVLPDSPMATPRAGDFVFWRQYGGGAFTGTWSHMDRTIKDVKKKLKEFFTLFLKANPK